MMDLHIALYREMYRIRRFEETVLEQFSTGVFHGTTHTYIGQEANAVGVLQNLGGDDLVFSNHRCHGHFLAYGGNMPSLFAELMGKSTGVCGGRGGSQHLHWRNFYSNGILGGTAPVATGAALAEKQKGTNAITVIFLGDGALGQGVLYESLNMASLWSAPILYILENNQIAQTTPIRYSLAGTIPERFKAFGIHVEELDSSDVVDVQKTAAAMVNGVRQNQTPAALVLQTCRFGPHSKGDDTRPTDLVEAMRRVRDPLTIQAKRLTHEEIQQIDGEVDEEVSAAFEQALFDPEASG